MVVKSGAEEVVLTMIYLSASVGCSLTIDSNIFSLIYFSAGLLAFNTFLMVRGLRMWLLLMGTILQLLHVIIVFMYMAHTKMYPYILCATVFIAAVSVIPAPYVVSTAGGLELFALVPFMGGVANVACWFWLKNTTGFDTFYLDFSCITLAAVCLCIHSIVLLKIPL